MRLAITYLVNTTTLPGHSPLPKGRGLYKA